MRFYHIMDEYIAFLRAYDQRVALNKSEKRPYVGVVLEISGIKYYAPFTSPKHQTMKNTKDFRKIGDGTYGAINFNNMIPVPDEALLLFDIESEQDLRYRRLLQKQYVAVSADWEAIQKTAQRLRTLIYTDDANLGAWDKAIKARCCDLKCLEKVYNTFTV